MTSRRDPKTTLHLVRTIGFDDMKAFTAAVFHNNGAGKLLARNLQGKNIACVADRPEENFFLRMLQSLRDSLTRFLRWLFQVDGGDAAEKKS